MKHAGLDFVCLIKVNINYLLNAVKINENTIENIFGSFLALYSTGLQLANANDCICFKYNIF